MHLRNKLGVAATVLSLGGLTGVAMSAGPGRKRDQGGAQVADVRTVMVQQTVHRYRHVGVGGPAGGAGGSAGGRVLASWKASASAVHTRVSGHKTSADGATLSGSASPGVKSKSSGAHHTTKQGNKGGATHTAPATTRFTPGVRPGRPTAMASSSR